MGKIASLVHHDLVALAMTARYVHLEVKAPKTSVLAVFRGVTIRVTAATPAIAVILRVVMMFTLQISALSGSAELLVQSIRTSRRALLSQMKLLKRT
jgi:hypothetical protein